MFRAKACYPHAGCLRECASTRAASLGHRAPECNLSVVALCLGVRRAQLSRSRRATTEKNGCLQRAGPCRKALRSMIWSRLLLSSSFAPGSFGGSLVQRWRSCSSELPSAGCCGTQARPASSSSERAAWSEASQSEDACLVAGPWRGWLEQTDDDTQISFTCRVRRTVQRTMLSRSSWIGCTPSPRIFPRGRSCWRLILDGVTLRQRCHGYRGAGLLYVDLTDLSRHRGRLSWCGSRSDAADTRQGLLELLKKTLKICDSNAVCKSSTGLRLENCAASSQAHEGESGRRV